MGSKTWTTSADFGSGTLTNLNYTATANQLQIDAATNYLDQSQTVSNAAYSGHNIWQSFTPGTTGSLGQIELFLACSYAGGKPGTFFIYEGSGIAGILLAEEVKTVPNTTGWLTIPFDPKPHLVAGCSYTIKSNYDAYPYGWGYKNGWNLYLGGVFSVGATGSYDARFKTYVYGWWYVGTWSTDYDSGFGGTVNWGTLNQTNTGSVITRVKTADSQAGLTAAAWSGWLSSGSEVPGTARWIRLQTRLERASDPILNEIGLEYEGGDTWQLRFKQIGNTENFLVPAENMADFPNEMYQEDIAKSLYIKEEGGAVQYQQYNKKKFALHFVDVDRDTMGSMGSFAFGTEAFAIYAGTYATSYGNLLGTFWYNKREWKPRETGKELYSFEFPVREK